MTTDKKDVMTDTARIRPVILSGGAGTRLWPLSRAALPKQFLPLADEETMIVTTAGRVADRQRFAAPLVVTGSAHEAIIREQLGDAVTLIVEPAARNTAPAIALAVMAVLAEQADALLLVMPSDHRVADPEALLAAVDRAAAAARDGWLVTFGIHAAGPESGYGYIRAGETLMPGVQRAAAFIEKPDRVRAEALLAEGGYSWNSGIFLFSARAILDALSDHAPRVLAAAAAAMAAAISGDGSIRPAAAAFAAAPSISIDHAVFEHAARVAVCPVDPGWSDIGSWDALYDIGERDDAGNVVSGRVESLDTQGCLLQAEGVLLAAIGVSDLNIVATPDAILVTSRGRSQSVRDIAARLPGDVLLARPLVRNRAWGQEQVVHDAGGLAVHKLQLTAGAALAPGNGCKVMLIDGDASMAGIPLAASILVDCDGVADSGVSSTGGATLLIFRPD